MNGFNDQGLSNIDCFQIVVWDSGFTTKLFNQKFEMNSITCTDTGETNFFGQPVYNFYIPLAFQIASGSYHMNIGAQLEDVAGDQFVWSQGEDVDGFWFTDANGQHKWGEWRPLPNFIGNTAGGAFVMTAPAPGALAIAAFAGVIGGRRRRLS